MKENSCNNELKNLIEAKFGSQVDCAKSLNWSRQKLNYIVNGQRIPSLQDTIDLANCLEIPLATLSQKILS